MVHHNRPGRPTIGSLSRGLSLVLLVACLLGEGLAPPPAEAADAPLDRSRFIGVDEIKPGMRGTGLTTFSSRGVEEFEVEVIGVLRRWIPGGDLILIEAAGGPLAETGIYRGMSGSPVYFDGRLAGAISYNMGGFAERPIGGVTPIAEMLRLFDDTAASTPTGDSPEMGDATKESPSALVRGRSLAATDIAPIRTPLVVAGLAPATRAVMAPLLDRLGVELVSGGASGAASETGEGAIPETKSALAPGAPVGVQIVRGDVEATALGTITMVDAERVLAFGHPMFLAGKVDLPMTRAHVYTVYPSQAISFVLGAAAEPVGRVVTDQQTGVAGLLGGASPMVPLTIDLKPSGGETRRFQFEVASNKFFLSQFIGVLAFNSFVADQKSFGDATLSLQLTVELADGTRLDFDDVLASNVPPNALAEAVSAPVSQLLFQSIAPVEVESVHIDLGIVSELRTAVIEELEVDRFQVEAGQSFTATVYLRPYETTRQAVELTIPVPREARPGPLLLRACSASEAARWEAERAPRRFAPSTVEQLVDLYEESGAHHVMRVSLHADARGVVVEGREMQGLPGSVFEIMDSNRRRGGRSGSWGRRLYEERTKTDFQLSGCEELRLEVRAPAAGGNGSNGRGK